MKYINADRVTAKIDNVINVLKKDFNPNPKGTIREVLADAWIETLEKLRVSIDEMAEEFPTPSGIEEESLTTGWLDYGMMMSEIGLNRSIATRRIKEHKEQFDPQAVPDLYHVAEYYKAVGAEQTCCCLQVFAKDFMFTKDEVREIVE